MNSNYRFFLLFLVVLVGFFGIIATSDKKDEPTGEFLAFQASPSVICLNQTPTPIVRVAFRVKSSNSQCVNLKINNQVLTLSPQQQRKCGQGEWEDSYTFNLNTFFGNNIPPNVTIEGELLTNTAPTVIPKLMDTATASVRTETNCPPPGLIGN